VDVDRHAVDLAVERAAIEQAGGLDELLPALLGGELGEVAHEAGLHQLLGLLAVVEHRGAHRLAAGDAADHDRSRDVARARDRAVDPLVPGRVERLRELGDRSCLAAGGPPVGDLQVDAGRTLGLGRLGGLPGLGRLGRRGGLLGLLAARGEQGEDHDGRQRDR
jgi:hypothetical protein